MAPKRKAAAKKASPKQKAADPPAKAPRAEAGTVAAEVEAHPAGAPVSGPPAPRPKPPTDEATVEAALQPLKNGFDAAAAQAVAELVLGRSWPGEVATLVTRELLDMYAAFDGEHAAQHWVLSLLAAACPSLVDRLDLDDVSMLAIFTGMVADAPSVAAHLPTVIGLAGTLYRTATARCVCEAAAKSTDDVDGLLDALEGIRQQLKSVAAPSADPGSSLPACHAAGALLDAALALAPVDVLELRMATGAPGAATEPAVFCAVPSALPADLAGLPPRFAELQRTAQETAAALLAALMCPHNTVRACVAITDAVDQLLRQRASLAPSLVPDLLRVAQTVGRRGSSAAVAPGCLTPGFTEAFVGVCSTICRAGALSSFHRMAESAASALGGSPNLPPPVSGSLDGATALPASFITTVVAGADGDGGDDAAEAVSGNAEEKTVETALGKRTLGSVVDAVILSLKRLDHSARTDFSEAHARGLREMARLAAIKAQQLEYERLRRHVARGIDGVAVGRMLDQMPGRGERSLAKGAQTLQQPRLRGAYARAAFHSSFTVFERLVEASGPAALTGDGRVARAQAAVARCMSLVPEDAADECLDRLCEALDGAKAASAARGRCIKELALQSLFVLALELAPSSGSFNFQAAGSNVTFGGSGGGHAGDEEEQQHGDTPSSGILAGVDLSNPVGWLTDGAATGARKSKRGREGGAVEDSEFELLAEATVAPTTAYSHLLCRLLHVCLDSGDVGSVLDLLTQCPVVTVPAWAVVHRALCLSNSLPRVKSGISMLAVLLGRRPPLAPRALSLLLHYCTASRQTTRLFACQRVVALARSPSSRLLPTIVAFAREAITKLATLKTPRSALPVAGQTAEQALHQKVEKLVTRHASIGAVLCSVEPTLLAALFKACAECEDRLVQAHLVTSTVVRSLFRELARGEDANGVPRWVASLKTIRAHPDGAEKLAVCALRTYGDHLMAQLRNDHATDAERSTFTRLSSLLADQCTKLYEKRGDDIRYLFPVFPFLPREDLKARYIPALLSLAEPSDPAQAARQLDDLDAGMLSMFRQCGLGEGHGISPADLFVLLHQLPEDRVVTQKAASVAIQRLLTTLTKPTEAGTEPVMGPTEMTKGLHALVSQPNVPSLVMRSALIASAAEPHAKLMQRVVLQGVVKALIKRLVWRQERQDLWRGVVIFLEKYWPTTMDTLLTLPDRTLEETVRANPKLHELLIANLDALPRMTQQLIRNIGRA